MFWIYSGTLYFGEHIKILSMFIKVELIITEEEFIVFVYSEPTDEISFCWKAEKGAEKIEGVARMQEPEL